jgi:type II secretory pathway pseudopilin PulG
MLVVGIISALGAAQAGDLRQDENKLSQAAELEQQIHATFHAAVSVHDPVNGDSSAVITQRIREALSIWAEDAQLTVLGTSAAAGNYIGNGDPDDPASCPLPSGDTSATGQQGTLCTFFKYVSGGLQQANKFVSLSPAYKTKFVPVKGYDGQSTSSVYFECHYFDVSLNPASGQPFWTAKSHVSLDGEAKKINGRWLLTRVSSSAVPVPVP